MQMICQRIPQTDKATTLDMPDSLCRVTKAQKPGIIPTNSEEAAVTVGVLTTSSLV